LIFTEENIQMIRSEAKYFEKKKEIPKNILEFIYEHKLFKMIVPKELNGSMYELPKAVELFQEASRIDGNFGWVITIGSGGGMFVPNMKKQTAINFYSPKKAVIAGSGFPAGTAEPTDNGYIINGKWFYCSGSQYANGFTTTSFIKDKEDIVAAVLKPYEVNVNENWDAFGLKGTSSHTINVTDQFVPSNRIFSVLEKQNSFGSSVHAYPFKMFSEASFAAISIGIGKHFLEEVDAILEKNKINWSSGSNNRFNFLKSKLNEKETKWKIANDRFHDAVKSTWSKHKKGEVINQELQDEFSIISKRSVTTIIHIVDDLFRYLGMQAVMENNYINQIWRDLHTASQHTFLIPQNKIEATPY